MAISLRARRERARSQRSGNASRPPTPREAGVFALVVTRMLGKTAGELGIAEKTVTVHRARVMETMRAGSLVELVQLAGEAGVLAVKS